MIKHYATCTDEHNSLIILDDNQVTIATLSHISTISNDRLQTETFDDPSDMMHFINDKTEYYAKSQYTFFLARAYEIIDEHYIKLYYRIESSNS